MTAPCVASLRDPDPGAGRPTCRPIRGSHEDGCQDDRCTGCRPRPAEAPHLVCRGCRLAVQDRLPRLARLSDDLLAPTRSGPRGERPATGDSSEEAPPGPDRAREARDAIRHLLVTWCLILEADFDVAPPVDDIRAMAVHVWLHSATLLADLDHADQLVLDVHGVWTEGTRLAYPAAPPGQSLGRCPTCAAEVRSTDTQTARCPGCGATRTVDDWRAVIVGDLAAEASATKAQLAAYLSARHERPITPTTLANWRNRPTGGHPRLEAVGANERGEKLYPVALACQIAEALHGAPRTADRKETSTTPQLTSK